MKRFKTILCTLAFLILSELAVAQPNKSEIRDSVFNKADQMPEFRKGTLEEFLTKNLDYPKDALERKIQGKVFVGFVVDEAGKVQDAKILKGIGYGCDEEALDVVNATSGKWNSGLNESKKVKVRMNLPIAFKIAMPDGK